MRSVDRLLSLTAVVLLPLSAVPRGESLDAVYRQRYAMGTMFDVIVYHTSRVEAARAAANALDEIVRLEAVMSHYRADSDLTKLNGAGGQFVTVDPSLYDVIRQSLDISRASTGQFDVTMAPLLRAWKRAADRGSRPADVEIAEAKRCVGFRNIELEEPNRIRLRAGCTEVDLGGIGKGYAVDRALAILRAAGIRHSMINAGGSSIAATGAPAGRTGWPVLVGRSILVLKGRSVSTSQPDPASPYGGDIIDPRRGVPAESRIAVSVIAPSATVADALSTTLLLFSVEEGKQLLAQFPDAAALWVSPEGRVHAAFRESLLDFARAN